MKYVVRIEETLVKHVIVEADNADDAVNIAESAYQNGNIEFEIGELNEEEIEDLKHLRVNNINGVIFDDREIEID